MNMFVRTPWHYWLLTILGILWFAMGAFDYVMTSIGHEAYMSQLTDVQRAWLDARPMWFTAAWAISIWASVLGAVLMMFRTAAAIGAFWVSLLGYGVACVWSYGLSSPTALDVTGMFGLIFSFIIGLSILFFIRYCAIMRNRGVMS